MSVERFAAWNTAASQAVDEWLAVLRRNKWLLVLLVPGLGGLGTGNVVQLFQQARLRAEVAEVAEIADEAIGTVAAEQAAP